MDPKKKTSYIAKILMAAVLTALCILMLKQSPSFNAPSVVCTVIFICYIAKLLIDAFLTSLCILMLKQLPSFNAPSPLHTVVFLHLTRTL